VIIGSGPAEYTAAIYAGRAKLKPLMFDVLNIGSLPVPEIPEPNSTSSSLVTEFELN